MACTSRHCIKLKGCGDSLVFSRNLVKVSGSIDVICSSSVEIRSQLGVCHASIFNKSFKHLIRLQPDVDNVVEVKYCNASEKLIFKHKSIENVHYDVQPFYIINRNADGSFQTDESNNGREAAMRKIDLALELTQCIISEKFNENQLGERSFMLRKCEVFNSDLDASNARSLNQWELYDAIASELLEKQGSDVVKRRKFIGFLSCTKFDGLTEGEEYSYANIKSKTFANPALGGGFLCLMGSGCFFSWPNNIDEVINCFSNKREIDLRKLLDDSNYRKTYGGCFSTSLGALVHEIGHVFDLAHTETGLMGNDIDYTHRFFLSENFTEILPKRIVKKCQLQDQIKEKPLINQRITKLKKPGSFLGKYYEQKGNDLTFFEPNCLVTLFNHRWFTQTQSSDNNISFLKESRTIISKVSPIKLVELRELDSSDALLIKFWPLLEKNVKEFQIPMNENLNNVTLFAITTQGEILKTVVTS